MERRKRNTIYNPSKYQRAFLYPVVIAFFLGCITSWLSLFYHLIGQFIFDTELYQFKRFIPIILSAVTIAMILVILWTIRISSQRIGPHERIVKELDQVLDGDKKSPLVTRKDDIIFNELLERINALIERSKS